MSCGVPWFAPDAGALSTLEAVSYTHLPPWEEAMPYGEDGLYWTRCMRGTGLIGLGGSVTSIYRQQEFLMNEARYSSLTRSFPDRAKELFELNEETAKARYEKLTRLQKMYEA